jgi:hypothetical protein
VIDAVVPAHPKDFDVLRLAVRSLLRHVVPLRRVVVVSSQPFSYRDERVVSVPEPALPTFPSLAEVRARRPELGDRVGWIYQQLLKLGAPEYVPHLSERFLAMDADVIFLRRVSFGPELPRFPYSRATELNRPYLDAYRRLTGETAVEGHSFVAHHMLFDQSILAGLVAAIASRHDLPWYWSYTDTADPEQASSVGEWDIYGQWALAHHFGESVHRQVFWKDTRTVPGVLARAALGLEFDFVAAHNYARESRGGRAWHIAKRVVAEVVSR